MISTTSVLTKLTMPESIWCSFCDAVCVRSTASASSSIDSSAFFGARRPMRLLMRISTYATGYTAQLNSRSGCEKVRATFIGLLCENTLGMISPKSSSRNVTTDGLEQKLVHAAEAEYGIDQIRGQY